MYTRKKHVRCQKKFLQTHITVNSDTLSQIELNMGLWNIQSIKSKVNNLFHYMSENNTEIFLVTKTWLHDQANLQYITANIQGLDYNIPSIGRQNRKGGGIACIYKKNVEMSKFSADIMNLLKH